jgi:alcohol dehydrogenase
VFYTYPPTPKIFSGQFSLQDISDQIPTGRILLCSSKSVIQKTEVQKLLTKFGSNSVTVFAGVNPNPSFEDINSFLPQAREFKPDVLVAIGGGSVIDFTKIIGLAVSNPRVKTAEDLQGVGLNLQRSIQIVAIPTTCGTGAEVTPFATIWDKVNNVKCSIENPQLRPDLVVLNGKLSSSSSYWQVLCSGLDAVSHCVETLWNIKRSGWSSGFAINGLTSILEVFPKILAGVGSDKDWHVMQESAMFAGLAISTNHTAIAHAISYPLTAKFQVPHGLACSFSIPYIWRMIDDSTKNSISNGDLISAASNFIDSLSLVDLMQQYVSVEQICSVADEMLTTDRAGNFIVQVNPKWIDQLSELLQSK